MARESIVGWYREQRKDAWYLFQSVSGYLIVHYE
jgi:hypothetical protein